MNLFLSLALAILLAACAQRQIVNEAAQLPPERSIQYPDLPSFRLADTPNEEKESDQELSSIPTEVNPMVEKWIAYFQGRGAVHMERYLARSTRYEKLMKRVLKDNGLPEDLFYIALIESGFSSKARSHASAVGYWQFIRGTGKRYGLEINKFVDERRDPVLATQAAAEYFKGLYSVFDSWYLAMASYNVGENRVKKEVMRNYTRDFWELAKKRRFPRETINYIPKFIAAKIIAKNPEKYGFTGIDYLPPIEYDQILVDHAVNLRLMSEKLNVNYEDFKALNPKFKGEIAVSAREGKLISLRVPPGMTESGKVAALESQVEKVVFVADAGDTQIYRIRRGDTLSGIARKFRTTVAYIRDLNDLTKGKHIRIGQKIQVPDRTPLRVKRSSYAKGSSLRTKYARNIASTKRIIRDGKYHIVQSGDNLTRIAKKYSVSVSDLKKVNHLKRGGIIKLGARIKLPENEMHD